MQTPNDYLRALLLEEARERGLKDSDIQRAHLRAYGDSTLAIGTINRFRNGYVDKQGVKRTPEIGAAPSPLMEEAFAAALGTSREALWEEAFSRWSAAMSRRGRQSAQQRSA